MESHQTQPNIKAIKDMTPEELKKHKAEISRRNYYKRKDEILCRRKLSRISNGSRMLPSSSSENNRSCDWTDKEKQMIDRSNKNFSEKIYVTTRTPQFIEKERTPILKKSNGRITLLDEDPNDKFHIFTKKMCQGKKITCDDIIHTYNYLIDNDILLSNKSEIQKNIGKKKYASKFNISFKIYGTDNALDIYTNPERFYNKLVTSHLSQSSIKDYLSIFISFYKKSGDIPKSVPHLNPTIYSLQKLVPLQQIQPFQKWMKNTIKLSKENEMLRLETAPYYKWEDIQKIPAIIANHPEGNTLNGLRDQVIACFYINENVLRDNLGAIVIGDGPQKDKNKATSSSIANKPNYLDMRNNVLYMNDFKTNKQFKNFKINISPETMNLTRTYINKVEQTFGERPTYLISKNEGGMYKDGKLSSYISDMFEKYTGVKGFTINHLRHSVATFHRNSTPRIKEYIAYLLQHSYKQHIRYERHSDVHLKFPILDNVQIQTRERISISDEEDIYVGKKVAMIMHTGRLKGAILTGKIKINTDKKTKPTYKYIVMFNDRKIEPVPINLPNTDIKLM